MLDLTHDRSGAFLIAFALAPPVLLGPASVAVKYIHLLYRKAKSTSRSRCNREAL